MATSLKEEPHTACAQFPTPSSSSTEVRAEFSSKTVLWMKATSSEIFGSSTSNNVNGHRYKPFMDAWLLGTSLVCLYTRMRYIFLGGWMRSTLPWMDWRSWNSMRIRISMTKCVKNVCWMMGKGWGRWTILWYHWWYHWDSIIVWRWRSDCRLRRFRW